MPISGEIFKKLGQTLAGAVSIVTAYDQQNDTIVALTVSSFVTLSFDPPLVMFAIQHKANSYPAMVSSKAYGVSVLKVEQSGIAQKFATKGQEKTATTQFDHGTTLTVPLIPGSLAQIECLTNQIILSGDHAIIVGLVAAARTQEGRPLLYHARRFGEFSALLES